MSNLAQTIAELTFSYAERKAVWLNRYNKDDQDLYWAYKEGFYQRRIRELLGHLPPQKLLQLHAIITDKLSYPDGELTRRRSVAEVVRLAKMLQSPPETPQDDT